MGKNIKSFFWNFSENITIQLIQFSIGVLMARILSPSDYGLIGILYVYIAVCTTIMNAGLSLALIRNTQRTESDFCTAFYFNIVVGMTFAILLWSLSPYISSFYEQPLLKDLTKVMAIPLVINSFNIVQRTRYMIDMNFKQLAKIGIISAIFQGISGLIMVYNGLGVWSIAWSSVIGAMTNCILCWCWSNWRPRKSFSIFSFKKMFKYSSKLLASSLLDTIWNNIYPLIIGKCYSPISLGYFTRSQHYATLPASTITDVISRVSFPILSERQDNKKHLKQTYNQMIQMSAFLTFPLMIGIATLSTPLIHFMLTEKWMPCVPYLQILCIAMMLYPINALNLNLLKVIGRSDLFLKLEVWKKIIGVLIMCITIPFGLLAICYGMLFLSAIAIFINSYYTGKYLQLGVTKQLKIFFPILISSSIMSAIIHLTRQNIHHDLVQLILGCGLGIIVYAILSYWFMPIQFNTILSIIKGKKNEY